MKGYESWHFRDRSFALAVTLSLGWHFFWFFALTITVSPEKTRYRPRPHIVSLGPVLDDTLLRTLVDTRPQVSQVLYRQWTDFKLATEVPAQTVQRSLSSDVVSIPSDKQLLASLHSVLGGTKASPTDDSFSKVKTGYADGSPDKE